MFCLLCLLLVFIFIVVVVVVVVLGGEGGGLLSLEQGRGIFHPALVEFCAPPPPPDQRNGISKPAWRDGVGWRWSDISACIGEVRLFPCSSSRGGFHRPIPRPPSEWPHALPLPVRHSRPKTHGLRIATHTDKDYLLDRVGQKQAKG